MLRAIIRGAIEVAVIAVTVVGTLFAQPPSCDEATVLGLEISGEIVAPADVVARVAADLAIIRNAYPGVASITAMRDWTPGMISVGLTPGAWAQYLAGTYTALDALNDEYGMVVLYQSAFSRTLRLAAQACSNPIVISEAYWALAGVEYAEPNWRMGDGDDIISTQLGSYTFKHGFGDCLAGCPFNHYWQFEVNNDAVTLVSESGDALSAEVGSFGAVKVLFR